MQEDIRQQVLTRIEQQYGLKHRSQTDYMRGGKCPQCSKKELYTNFRTPWVLRCGRQAKCGHEVRVKDLYDDLFDDYSKQHPQTQQQPNAAADAYLQTARGFSLASLSGLYAQDSYYDRKIQQGTATVRFALVKGGWWERLIDRPHRFGKQKARFAPGQSYAGVWWMAPSVATELRTAKEIWITEGIFDAIALMEHDIAAVSGMSSNAYPEESLVELKNARLGDLPTLVWALDNEPGARAYTAKHAARAEKLGFRCKAAQIPQRDGTKTDWNDLHLRALASDSSEEQWHADIAEARYQGDLLLAKSAVEKGLLMFGKTERRQFHLAFRSRLYWFDFDSDRFDKLCREHATRKEDADEDLDPAEAEKIRRACCSVREIANCYPQALYFQSHAATDEAYYYFRVDMPHDGPSATGTFTSSQAYNAPTFRDRLGHIAPGAMFDGTGSQLLQVMKDQLFNIKTVNTVDFVGYSPEHGAYIFGDIAVQNGEIRQANSEDYFEFNKLRLKTTQKSIRLDIQRDAEAYRTDWLPWLWLCFGTHGIVALTYWFGSLFANQIRAAHKSFPFLEATGEAGAGKTTLLTFLWKLLARCDYEGFDPAKSSKAGRARGMGQISGMPVVLLEADRDSPGTHAKSFEWDELKDYFGGGTLAVRGVRNASNDTYEPPFRGTIVISQNAPVDASEAILTRIVKLHFKKPKVTTESRIAADNLNALQVEDLSHFLIKAVRAESKVMEMFATGVRAYEASLREETELRLERVIKNHAQMLALLDCLGLVVDLPPHMVEQTRKALRGMAMERQLAISADHPMVNEFWETFEYIDGLHGSDRRLLNHSRTDDTISINLNEFMAAAARHGQATPDLNTLRKLLPESRRHKFIGSNVAVNSAIRSVDFNKPATVKCWTFKKK
ncbi:toprim domain-containing protein [Stenotrophomonas sp. Iso1]|uniref:toprim domain-containing protein n=1 Tax=Stenotrophomonas sp. Iso1 TaxID=2977283 RepID=UPI0022B7C789|nr:toprim domain-containing protein [Stenotrophomonas sp. Iso1]